MIYYKSGILIIFFLLGVLYSILLLQKGIKHRIYSSMWLSLLIFLGVLYITPWMLGHRGWYESDGFREFLFYMPFHHLFLIGPVILFYIRSLINPQYSLGKLDYIHLLPAITYLIYSLVVFIGDVVILQEKFFYADFEDKDLKPWYQYLGMLHLSAYTLWTFSIYRRYHKRIYDELSFADAVVFSWLGRFLIALLAVIILRVVFFVIYPGWGDFGPKWWHYFGFALVFYYIAFEGYTYTIKFSLGIPESGLIESDVAETKSSPVLKDEELADFQKSIQEFIHTKGGFSDPSLTLQQLAISLDTHPKKVSVAINRGFGMNFNDFINKYRIEEFKKRIKRGEHHKFTLLSIALDCGFNSKTTFNRVFKKITNETPQEYLQALDSGSKS